MPWKWGKKQQFKKQPQKLVFLIPMDKKFSKHQLYNQTLKATANSLLDNDYLNSQQVQYWKKYGQMKISLKTNTQDMIKLLKQAKKIKLHCGISDEICYIGPDSVEQIDKITGHLKLM